MRFPGNRNAKYYFPVTEKRTRMDSLPIREETTEIPLVLDKPFYVLGLDETIVDLEVHGCSFEMVQEMGLIPGESVVLESETLCHLLDEISAKGLTYRYSAGGTVANTLANYTHLSGEPAVLLGAFPNHIVPGSPAFAYVAQAPKALSLDHLKTVQGNIGLAVTCFTPDGERSFGVAPGISGDFGAADISESVVKDASVVLASAYLIADPNRPIRGACIRLMELAAKKEIPIAFGLGTAGLVRQLRQEIIDILEAYVTVAAMNASEAEALTGESDTLLACKKLLEWVDFAVVTEGASGLTLCGYTDDSVKRETRLPVRSKSVEKYNQFEFSRLVHRQDSAVPLQVFSHTHPYRGGPEELGSTSGAGDAALAAVLHDVAANHYHRATMPESLKHASPIPFLTYSSIARNAQYANRVAYEVLKQRSPRLEGAVGSDDD